MRDTHEGQGGRRRRQARQCNRRTRTLQCHQRTLMHLDFHACVAQFNAQMGDIRLGPRRVDHQLQRAAMIGDHDVIQDTAGFIEEHGVALPARRQARDVTRHKPLQRRGGARSGQAHLPHVRNVEQTRRIAHRMVFGQRALVLHRHGPPGEAHHPRPQPAMQPIQRRGPQRNNGFDRQ